MNWNRPKPKSARAAFALTKEALRKAPRRDWWKLSLKGIKEAATIGGDIGKPVVETVAAVSKLLAGASGNNVIQGAGRSRLGARSSRLGRAAAPWI
jgi:hypothetical protein